MRRFRLTAWLLLAALLFDWAPGIPPVPIFSVAQVKAQNTTPSLFGVGNPQAIWYSTASQIVNNTTAGVTLLSMVVPGSLFATSAAANFQSINLGPANSSIPLHIIMEGLLSTQATPAGISLGVNYGVGTTTRPSSTNPFIATLAILNGTSPLANVQQGPIRIDIWLNPIATGTATNATPNIVNTVYMRGSVEGLFCWPQAPCLVATHTRYNAATIAQVNIASAHILNVLWQFNGANNALNLFKVLIKEGE